MCKRITAIMLSCLFCKRKRKLFLIHIIYGSTDCPIKDYIVQLVGPVEQYLKEDHGICKTCLKFLNTLLYAQKFMRDAIACYNDAEEVYSLTFAHMFSLFQCNIQKLDYRESVAGYTSPDLITVTYSTPHGHSPETELRDLSDDEYRFRDSNELLRGGTPFADEEVQEVFSRKTRRKRKRRTRSVFSRSRSKSKSNFSVYSEPVRKKPRSRRSSTKLSEFSGTTDTSFSLRYDDEGRLLTKRTRSVSRIQDKLTAELTGSAHKCVDGCRSEFDDIDILTEHKIKEHKMLAKYWCYECYKKKFTSQNDLDKHSKLCHKEEAVNCLLCCITLASSDKLQEHLEEHRIHSVPCTYCDLYFLSGDARQSHIKECHKGRKKRIKKLRPQTILDRIDREAECDNNSNGESLSSLKKNYSVRILIQTPANEKKANNVNSLGMNIRRDSMESREAGLQFSLDVDPDKPQETLKTPSVVSTHAGSIDVNMSEEENSVVDVDISEGRCSIDGRSIGEIDEDICITAIEETILVKIVDVSEGEVQIEESFQVEDTSEEICTTNDIYAPEKINLDETISPVEIVEPCKRPGNESEGTCEMEAVMIASESAENAQSQEETEDTNIHGIMDYDQDQIMFELSDQCLEVIIDDSEFHIPSVGEDEALSKGSTPWDEVAREGPKLAEEMSLSEELQSETLNPGKSENVTLDAGHQSGEGSETVILDAGLHSGEEKSPATGNSNENVIEQPNENLNVIAILENKNITLGQCEENFTSSETHPSVDVKHNSCTGELKIVLEKLRHRKEEKYLSTIQAAPRKEKKIDLNRAAFGKEERNLIIKEMAPSEPSTSVDNSNSQKLRKRDEKRLKKVGAKVRKSVSSKSSANANISAPLSEQSATMLGEKKYIFTNRRKSSGNSSVSMGNSSVPSEKSLLPAVVDETLREKFRIYDFKEENDVKKGKYPRNAVRHPRSIAKLLVKQKISRKSHQKDMKSHTSHKHTKVKLKFNLLKNLKKSGLGTSVSTKEEEEQNILPENIKTSTVTSSSSNSNSEVTRPERTTKKSTKGAYTKRKSKARVDENVTKICESSAKVDESSLGSRTQVQETIENVNNGRKLFSKRGPNVKPNGSRDGKRSAKL